MIFARFQMSGITRLCIDKFISPERNLKAFSPSFFSMSIDSPLRLMALDSLALFMMLAIANCSKYCSCRPLRKFLNILNVALLLLFCTIGCSTNCLQNCLALFLPSICCLSPNSIAERFLSVLEPDRVLIVLQSFLGHREQRSRWFSLEVIDSSSTGFTALILSRC